MLSLQKGNVISTNKTLIEASTIFLCSGAAQLILSCTEKIIACHLRNVLPMTKQHRLVSASLKDFVEVFKSGQLNHACVLSVFLCRLPERPCCGQQYLQESCFITGILALCCLLFRQKWTVLVLRAMTKPCENKDRQMRLSIVRFLSFPPTETINFLPRPPHRCLKERTQTRAPSVETVKVL